MRSKLFGRFDPNEKGNEQFVSDLKFLLSLPPDVVSKSIDMAADIALAETKETRDKTYGELETQTNQSQIVLRRTHRILWFFLKSSVGEACESDTGEDWAADLLDDLELLETNELDNFKAIATRIVKTAPLIRPIVERREYTQGVLPSFTSLGTTVELRAILERAYRWGTDIDDYEPRISDLVPVLSIHIGVDVGQNADFYFQASESDIEKIIAGLRAALAELREIKKLVPSTK